MLCQRCCCPEICTTLRLPATLPQRSIFGTPVLVSVEWNSITRSRQVWKFEKHFRAYSSFRRNDEILYPLWYWMWWLVTKRVTSKCPGLCFILWVVKNDAEKGFQKRYYRKDTAVFAAGKEWSRREWFGDVMLKVQNHFGDASRKAFILLIDTKESAGKCEADDYLPGYVGVYARQMTFSSSRESYRGRFPNAGS